MPANEIWTLERLGRPLRELHPGGHFFWPLIDVISRKFDTREVALNIPGQTVVTRDNVAFIVSGTVYYRILDAMKAAYLVSDLGAALRDMAQAQFQATISRRASAYVEEFRTQEKLNYVLLEKLGDAAAGLGVSMRVWRYISPGCDGRSFLSFCVVFSIL